MTELKHRPKETPLKAAQKQEIKNMKGSLRVMGEITE